MLGSHQEVRRPLEAGSNAAEIDHESPKTAKAKTCSLT
jgi:hypothetical protein